MIIPPADPDGEHWGHWLLGECLSQPSEHKGKLNISDDMLTYIKRLQRVPYKINTFVLEVMEHLEERNIAIKKFKPHRYVEPMSVSQALGLTGTYEDQTQAMQEMDKDLVSEAKTERSIAIARETKMVEDGRQSKMVLQNAQDAAKLEQFFYPFQWDFRGRVYCRATTAPNPQGPDYSKALVRFAEEQPTDDSTIAYLSIELANNAGMDKKTFAERIEWTSKHHREIKLVATMLEEDGDFSGAVSFLESLDEPFQFLAAAEEFYHLFILKDRKTTSIRCGVDMSCSAAGIHAGWKRDKAAAAQVNVSPGDRPYDLYINAWNELLAVNKKQPQPPIDPAILDEWTELGYGRKAAKKMIMVYQYSAGIRKQIDEFKKVNGAEKFPEHLQLNDDEIKALFDLWPQATSAVMSVQAIINWFQERVREIHKQGKTKVLIPNATGAVQEMLYPKFKKRRVKTFHNGQMYFAEPTGEADLKAWKRAILANVTHMTDGAILSIGLKDFDCPFSTVHDAAYCYANDNMTKMVRRLKEGYVEAVGFNIWDEFRKINGLDPNDPTTAFPTTPTLKLEEILDSDYIFA